MPPLYINAGLETSRRGYWSSSQPPPRRAGAASRLAWGSLLLLWCVTVLLFQVHLNGNLFNRGSPQSVDRIHLRRRLERDFPMHDTPHYLLDDGLTPEPSDSGICTSPVTVHNLDCYILTQVGRRDPYLLREQHENGELADAAEAGSCDGYPDGNTTRARSPVEIEALRSIQVLNKMNIADPRSKVTAADQEDENSEQEGNRILCLLLTTGAAHGNKLETVRSTWGWRCDGFLAFSDIDERNVSAIATPIAGPDAQRDWHKLCALGKYAWYHHGNEFDWFFVASDNTYMVMENLAGYLSQHAVQMARSAREGVLLGHRLRFGDGNVYTSGAAGTVLDRVALEKFVVGMDRDDVLSRTGMAEDVQLGKLLAGLDVLPFDTRDAGGAEQFHPFPPAYHLSYQGGDWYEDYKRELGLKFGLDSVSPNSVSFNTPEDGVLQWHRYLYRCKGELGGSQADTDVVY